MTPYALVQDFHDDEQVFRVGVKPLSIGSVDAAYGNRNRVVPVAAAHLTREIPQDYCRSGGSIDPSQSALNTSMLDDVPMNAAAIADRAIALMEQHGIKWRSLRKDKIMAIETVISPPPGFVGDLDAFFADGLHWTEYTAFGHQVLVIAAIIHADELNGDMTGQMTAPHLHVLTLPITADSRMDGHELVGFKGKHRNRNESFLQHVGKRYGLSKPTQKASLNKADRVQLADRLLAKFAADCPAWASNPTAMKSLRRMFLNDPVGMARAHGIALLQNGQADHQVDETAYMRSLDDVGLPAVETDRMSMNAVDAGTLPDAGEEDGDADDQDADIDPVGDDGGAGPVATLPPDPGPIRIVIPADPVPGPADELPEHIALPPPKQSKRQQTLLGVRVVLGSMPSAGRPRAPQVAPQSPTPAIKADIHQAQPAGMPMSPARLALTEARAIKAARVVASASPPAFAGLSPARMALEMARTAQKGNHV